MPLEQLPLAAVCWLGRVFAVAGILKILEIASVGFVLHRFEPCLRSAEPTWAHIAEELALMLLHGLTGLSIAQSSSHVSPNAESDDGYGRLLPHKDLKDQTYQQTEESRKACGQKRVFES